MHCALVGGAAPDHYISLENFDKDSIIAVIEEYRSGKKGILAEEVKVCLVVFLHVPPGMSPYFVLIGRPQKDQVSILMVSGEHHFIYITPMHLIVSNL